MPFCPAGMASVAEVEPVESAKKKISKLMAIILDIFLYIFHLIYYRAYALLT